VTRRSFRRPLAPAAGIVLVAAFAGAVGFASGTLGPSAAPGSPGPAAVGGPPSAVATAQPNPTPTPTPTPTPRPTPTPVPLVEVAIVPVTHFRTPYAQSWFADVEAVLAGTNDRYEALELVGADADAILAALGLDRPADPARLVLAPDAATVSADLASNRRRLAFVRAGEVWEGIRALAWGRDALFGVDRVATLADWPLVIRVPEPEAPAAPAYDPDAAWTLVAGGDILLDRGVYKTAKVDGKGVDFLFDGGTAQITSRYCCSSFGWELPRTQRTGGAGAMRALLQGADLAIANFENPAPHGFRWHTSGTVFSADPTMIDGLANAGIDWVSLANNHIRDAGGQGIIETIDNLDARGIAHSGAGRNLAAARQPALLEVGDTTVALLGYDAVASYYWATGERTGSARMTAESLTEDVAAARAAGADVVIVFPHWGAEYRATPAAAQQRLGRAAIEAGADMVIGNHAHWAAALEVHDGHPIWYALGNFVFDQTWSEPTMEGITLELTFNGADLIQARMRPHLILDKAQPNFLDPAADGAVVMDQVFGASKGLLDW
jgi:hypothetical protein